MKITMEFSKEDIFELIRKQLLASGLQHDMATAKYKGSAKLTIEVEGQILDVEEPVASPAPAPAVTTAPVAAVTEERPTKPQHREEPPPTPADDNVDMRGILAASNKNAATKQGIFPTPPRPLMDGESEEWPGVPEPRSR
jgi:hypothetical protein